MVKKNDQRRSNRILNFGAWWDNLNPEISDADSELLYEALDMAISALRAQQEQD